MGNFETGDKYCAFGACGATKENFEEGHEPAKSLTLKEIFNSFQVWGRMSMMATLLWVILIIKFLEIPQRKES